MVACIGYKNHDGASPMFPLTPRSAQCKIKAQQHLKHLLHTARNLFT